MKIPDSIQIGGHVYTILLQEKVMFDGKEQDGYVDHERLTIHLLDGISRLEVTFWHEILHAIDCIYNNESLKEGEVSSLSEGLYQAMKQLNNNG